LSRLIARRGDPGEPWEPEIDLSLTKEYRRSFLAGSEFVVYRAFRHPIVLTKQILISLGVLVLIILFGMNDAGHSAGGILGLALLGVFVYIAAAVAEWRFDRIVITNKRVIKVEGIVNRRISTIPLGKVTDTSYRRTWLGRILGYGELVLDTPGQDKYLPILDNLANPDRVYRAIMWIAIGGGGTPPPAPPAKPPPEAPAPQAPAPSPAIPRGKPPGDGKEETA
jgi:membrane protein YdbS with pleckstrin-like domain